MTAHGSMTDRGTIRARSLVAILLAVSLAGVAAKSSAPTCVSHAGYPDFLAHGKPPSKNRGLTFCQQYERSTCCDRGTTDGVRRVVAHMQANGFSPGCREVRETRLFAVRGEAIARGFRLPRARGERFQPPPLSRSPIRTRVVARAHLHPTPLKPNAQAWTSLECSVCDPRAGVAAKTPVCARVCDSVFRACAEEHFAEDALGRVVPCRASDTICAKLSDWMGEEGRADERGTQMCVAAGYDVVSDEAAWCFDGAASAGDALGAASSARSSSKTAENKKQKKKKSTRDGSKGMAESEAEEFAKLQSWMSRVYVAVGVGAVARVAYKVWDRRRAESGSGAARRAARLAAENRSRRAAFDNQAKML